MMLRNAVFLGLVLALVAGAANAGVTVTTSTTAPTSDILTSQMINDAPYMGIPWRFQAAAGVDRNPRDIGQTFLVDHPMGWVLDKVTVQLGKVTGDSAGFDFYIDTFTDTTDHLPDNRADPTVAGGIYDDTGTLPTGMSPDEYVTFDIVDQTLAPNTQYGFFLSHHAVHGNNIQLWSTDTPSNYADGIVYAAQNNVFLIPGGQPPQDPLYQHDLVFVLQGTPVPEPSTLCLATLGLLGLLGWAWRRRRRKD